LAMRTMLRTKLGTPWWLESLNITRLLPPQLPSRLHWVRPGPSPKRPPWRWRSWNSRRSPSDSSCSSQAPQRSGSACGRCLSSAHSSALGSDALRRSTSTAMARGRRDR
jgi:hypothetical protein